MKGKSDILLILDLDETLVYATTDKLSMKEDFRYEQYFIYKRPWLDKFLSEISHHFQIGIWSSAGDEYVNALAKQLTLNGLSLEILWARSKCTFKRDIEMDTQWWEKRLDKLKKKGFTLEKVLIVDDSPEKARNNFGNAIYVKPFMGDELDRELKLLYNYLLIIKNADNVRKTEKRNWRSIQP